MIFLYILGIITAIVVLAYTVPFAQYLYARFVQKEAYSIRYYFSQELFDRHMRQDLGLNRGKVVNNREEMQKLWEQEMRHKFP